MPEQISFVDRLIARRWFNDNMNTAQIGAELRKPEEYVDRVVGRLVDRRYLHLRELAP